LPSFRWGMVVKIDAEEAVAPAIQLRNRSILFVATIALALVVVASIITRTIASPRERVEVELRESEGRFRQLAENIRTVFWMTSPLGHEILYISPAYEEIWGLSCRSLYESPQSWREAVYPEDRDRVRASFARNVASGEMWQEVYRITQPDGALR